MNSTKLSCGIIVHDYKEAGISIENNATKHVLLCHRMREDNKKHYFYALTHSLWLNIEELTEFQSELEIIKQAMIEANELFNN